MSIIRGAQIHKRLYSLSKGSNQIFEAWDAKYGKPYLRDELDELSEKIKLHPEVKLAGFVVEKEPDMRQEIISKIDELIGIFGVEIQVLSFNDWVRATCEQSKMDIQVIGKEWIIALTESLAQKRRDYAPIDEPTFEWLQRLRELLEEF